MSNKLYRLKEDARKYFKMPIREEVKSLCDWDKLQVGVEALEEVEQRVEVLELEISDINKFGNSRHAKSKEIEICEKALNGELIDLESIDDEEFSGWYNSSYVTINPFTPSKIKGLTNVLKAYLERTK